MISFLRVARATHKAQKCDTSLSAWGLDGSIIIIIIIIKNSSAQMVEWDKFQETVSCKSFAQTSGRFSPVYILSFPPRVSRHSVSRRPTPSPACMVFRSRMISLRIPSRGPHKNAISSTQYIWSLFYIWLFSSYSKVPPTPHFNFTALPSFLLSEDKADILHIGQGLRGIFRSATNKCFYWVEFHR